MLTLSWRKYPDFAILRQTPRDHPKKIFPNRVNTVAAEFAMFQICGHAVYRKLFLILINSFYLDVMDLPAFVQSLTQKEKQDLFLILKEEFHPGELETVREFFERHLESDGMTVRLRSAYGEAISRYKKDPNYSCLSKAVKDATFEDLYVWRGMGEKTWQAFVALRGY